MQILFTGYEALAINAVMAVAIGAAINVIGSSLLPQFGQSKLMYSLLIIVITRELGPLLTAFVITARSGTAIATQLGTMVVNHEIEAYMAVGLNPISYLVVPRFIGVVVSMLVLTVYFNIFGLLGSFIVVQIFNPTPIAEYLGALMSTLTLGDVVSGLTKAFVFGIVVSVVATYQGFSVNRASTEIPVAGIKAVGLSFILIIVADVLVILVQYA
ncbi:ABC transporter permease [Spirochaetota bacterium]